MGRRCTADGLLTRRYAEARGVSVRTARNHRRAQSAEWLLWLSQQDAPAAAPPPADSSLARARDAVEAFFTAWRKLAAAIPSSSADTAPAAVKAASDAYRAYEYARARLVEQETDAGELIPRAAFVRVHQQISGGLGSAFKALKNSIALALLPDQRAAFYRAWEQASPKWEQQIDQLDALVYKILEDAGSPQK